MKFTCRDICMYVCVDELLCFYSCCLHWELLLRHIYTALQWTLKFSVSEIIKKKHDLNLVAISISKSSKCKSCCVSLYSLSVWCLPDRLYVIKREVLFQVQVSDWYQNLHGVRNFRNFREQSTNSSSSGSCRDTSEKMTWMWDRPKLKSGCWFLDNFLIIRCLKMPNRPATSTSLQLHNKTSSGVVCSVFL